MVRTQHMGPYKHGCLNTNHVKHKSNKHGKYHTNHETVKHATKYDMKA